MDNLKKVRIMARRISFLMPHQIVLSDLKELATKLICDGVDPDIVNRESPEYLLGAFEALTHLISALEEKGPPSK
jgi:hypothetical protein